MYKISEQQVTPKVLSVTNSCHYNENFKNGKHRSDKCPPLGSYPNKSPPPEQKPQGGGKFFMQIPGGMVMDEIDTCIMKQVKIAHSFLQSVSNQFHIIILSMPM